MEWFSTRAHFVSKVNGIVAEDGLCEWVLYLVFAQSPEDAMVKAAAKGLQNETSYNNEHGQVVSWEFCGIEEVQSLDEIELFDGVEVYSRMYRVNTSSD